MRFGHVALLVGVSAAASLQAANVVFQVEYQDAADEGFSDPTLGAARRAAFDYALGRWATKLEASYLGETIVVHAAFDPLGGSASSATLGSAGAAYVNNDFGSINPKYRPDTYYPEALANHLIGDDAWGSAFQEINAVFNSDVDGSVLDGTNWYYGTDAQPNGHIDFATVVMHEIGHGLGFSSGVSQNGEMSAYPMIYDRFAYGAVTGKTLDEMTDAERQAAIISDELYWDGAEGTAANGGERPKLYAPAIYEEGSSVAHLDESLDYHRYELMSPIYSVADHEPSLMELGMLSDMGWTVVPEPGIVGSALSIAIVALGRRQRKSA